MNCAARVFNIMTSYLCLFLLPRNSKTFTNKWCNPIRGSVWFVQILSTTEASIPPNPMRAAVWFVQILSTTEDHSSQSHTRQRGSFRSFLQLKITVSIPYAAAWFVQILSTQDPPSQSRGSVWFVQILLQPASAAQSHTRQRVVRLDPSFSDSSHFWISAVVISPEVQRTLNDSTTASCHSRPIVQDISDNEILSIVH